MSEPKAAPPLAEAHAAKKASKKSRRSTPPSAAVAPASAAPNPSPVPRISLAEPKADNVAPTAGDTRRRASKKRTSVNNPEAPSSSRRTSAAESAAPAVPAAAVTVDEAAAKLNEEAEREKQQQQQRREAKRQRAKEQEAARRRDELAKQALEDARRQEEQRQREARQKQQLQELNADAQECEEAEEDDYEDDGFENYDDDFEEPEPSAPKPPVATPRSAKASASAKSRGDDAELKRVQQAMQAESKGLSSSRPPSSSGSSAKKTEDRRMSGPGGSGSSSSSGSRPSSSIASSVAGLKQSLDPRAKRAKEILARRKLEVDKFHLFQQSPLSEHDRAMHRLRRGLVRQAFVQTSDGARTLGTQTKPPPTHDRSMHFPDDIGVHVADTDAGALQTGEDSGDAGSTSSSARFFRFLEHAAYVCEVLAVENVMAQEAEGPTSEEEAKQSEEEAKNTGPQQRPHQMKNSSELSRKQIFPTKKLDELPTLERVLTTRELAVLRFSPAVSSLLLTCYSPQSTEKQGKQQEPTSDYSHKTFSCVWDVNLLHRPLHVLANEGVVSVATLGPSRELFALAGTQDGSLHVWDLRPQSQSLLQSNCTPLDDLTPCVPVYSTCGTSYRAPEQHAAAVVALEPLSRGKGSTGSTSGGGFQFGSMDDRGVLLLWSVLEFEPQDEALVADKCVEIGGRVKLVLNTRIDTQKQYLAPLSSPKARPGGSQRVDALVSLCGVGPIATTLKFFPHDPNQFVVGTHSGLLLRGHRFDKASASRPPYRRGRDAALAAVVCVDFHPFEPEYFLVGYDDGSICLFHTDVALCLTSWEEVAFGVSVCGVAWSPSRPAVFSASFSNAQILVWDLLECTNGPTLTHELESLRDVSPVDLASSLYPLVLSSEKTRTSRPAAAWRCDSKVSAFQFAVHELGPEFTTRARAEAKTTASILASIL